MVQTYKRKIDSLNRKTQSVWKRTGNPETETNLHKPLMRRTKFESQEIEEKKEKDKKQKLKKNKRIKEI